MIRYTLLFIAFASIIFGFEYPVPIPPGGRFAVHGWLILPWDQPYPKDPSTPISGWFVHHTPEFWTNSPHNFQLIIGGTLTPMSVAENQTMAIDLPYPPESDLLVNEFTFTPPPPFSLNDLLSGQINQLVGVVYNGSFDTLYEREAIAIATLNIEEMPTAIWLNISMEIPNYSQIRYFSYPRSRAITKESNAHFYFSHEIHSMNTSPDFDQVIHGQFDLSTCLCKTCSTDSEMLELIWQAGAEWEIPNIQNNLKNRLMPSETVLTAQLLKNGSKLVECDLVILEEIHCVVGPAFADRC